MMNAEEKSKYYLEAKQEIQSVLENVTDEIACMATISCLLHQKFDYYFWTGFYRLHKPDELIIGPYQGTLGCLFIKVGNGVCGTAALKRETVIVPDVHEFPGHIACDSRSNSEIVVPVFNKSDHLIAVFDVDSTEFGAFDEVDQTHLEDLLTIFRK
ncbi:MAG: GAF domain-containing protein [Calditrichia bacterium]